MLYKSYFIKNHNYKNNNVYHIPNLDIVNDVNINFDNKDKIKYIQELLFFIFLIIISIFLPIVILTNI